MDPIGAISFGITVCQSLLDYYGSWKDAPEDVARTCASVEELLKTLRLLGIAIKYKNHNSEIVIQIQGSIESVEKTLRNIEKKLEKLRVVVLPNGWRDKAKAQLWRALYPFKESTLAKLRELCNEARDNLSLALDLLQIDASAAALQKLDLLGQQAADVSANVDFLKQQSTTISASVHDIAGSTRETARLIDSLALYEKCKELRAWLSGQFDPTQKQDETWGERHPHTGQWFLQSQDFRAWLEEQPQQTPRVLNLIGKSGAGKTSLISSAIKNAQLIARDNSQVAVAYYYCSYDEGASQDPIHMVGSFISQVSAVYPNMLEGLDVAFARKEKPSLKDLEERLAYQTARSSLRTLLFVDAVNECKKMEPMIEALLRLAQSANIRVLFTNTEESPNVTELTELEPPKATALRMSVSADIDLFIEARIQEKKNLHRLPPEMREEIKAVLNQKADGMFRWVQCQLEHLGNQPTARLIHQALRELPSDLNATYASIIARIPKNNQRNAREAMLWLSFAFRPLRLSELCEVLAFSEGDPTVDESDRLLDAHDLFRWCQGLITFHTGTSKIKLSHSSVRTYLLSDQIKDSSASFFSIHETVAERLLLRKCLTYMMFTDFSNGYLPNLHEWEMFRRRWPLLRYASDHWADHAYALDAELEPSDHELISRFYNTSGNDRGGNFGFWVQCLYPEADIRVARDTQPLYYAASFGLRAVVGLLISTNKDMDINALGGRHASTALQVACYRGHYGVAEDLLDAGASPYWKDEYGRSALFYALFHGDADIAELLRQSLRSRADPMGEAALDHIKEATAAAREFLSVAIRG
ncbi:MAG: hypothetical protein ASARMPREDX12_007895 [Alectoria sarmentosa]|nr:MAG: hypothetical protein ASARMPREDX12_007895 [Alectoria sarmentosa]